MSNSQFEEMLNFLDKEITLIYNNLESFERNFCDGNELISVSFNAENIKLLFIMDNGQHCGTSFKIDMYKNWRELL